MARSTSGESLISRVVRIVEAFDPDSPALTVSELARRADLPVATASRLINELVGYGWLRRDAHRRVRMGIRFWELAVRVSPTLGLRDVAMPFMQDLHAVIPQHVMLTVLQHHDVLYVERLSAPRAVRNVSRFAGRLPLHASAAGMVLLAHASTELQDAVLSAPLKRFTTHTVTDPALLRVMLSEIRRSGVVLLAGFINEEATSVAAPVRGPDNRVVASLSVLVPNDSAASATVPAVLATARGISRALGWSAANAAQRPPLIQ
jgi:DNA-binding IclR family transcriptional regulator